MDSASVQGAQASSDHSHGDHPGVDHLPGGFQSFISAIEDRAVLGASSSEHSDICHFITGHGHDLPLGLDRVLGADHGSDLGGEGRGHHDAVLGDEDALVGGPFGDGSDAALAGLGDAGAHDIFLSSNPDAHAFGAHAFFLTSGFGRDVVMQFHPGEDVLAIQANINQSGVNRPDDLAEHIAGGDHGAVIRLGEDSITLVGISRDDLLSHLQDHVKIV